MSKLAARAAVAAGVAAVAAVGLAGWLAFRPAADGDRFAECRATSVAMAGAQLGGAFSLTDHTGRQVTDAEVITGPTLIYFGYTYCPDICPFDVARMAEATDILAERGVEVTPLFITIDPARDDVATLRPFVEGHHPKMIGLTGSEEEVAAAARAWRVYRAKSGDEARDYLMDHSTFTYLAAPGHGFLDVFRRDLSSEEVAERTACFAGRL